MKLKTLLTRLKYTIVQGTEDTDALNVTNDTRNLQAGDIFVCVEGYEKDGHLFVKEAAARGASAVVVQKDVGIVSGITIVKVPDTRFALAVMSAAGFGYPAEKMKMIGITGTKGKTTTAWMIHSMLKAAGQKAGLIGTIQVDTGGKIYTNHNTTPESCQIQAYLKEMEENGCSAVVMEVSSQGLKLQRTAGIYFEAGVFTNLGHDHIGPGEHADFEEYKQCKRMLFGQCRYGIGNVDDPFYEEMFKDTPCEKITYGMLSQMSSGIKGQRRKADVTACDVQKITGAGRLGVRCRTEGMADCLIELSMPGIFNLYNALASVTVLKILGVQKEVIEQELPSVRVPGRMEPVPGLTDCTVFVDYAHNAMSLESSLRTLKEYGAGRVVAVFGCGGNRARERRTEMGRTAGTYADFTIVTTDNPRYEEPQSIIRDIVSGIEKTDGSYIVIEDRGEAIRYAISHRRPGDVVIIAGKGHETYQEIRGVRYDMDDRKMAEEAVKEYR